MIYVKIDYLGAQLEVIDWLAAMWPHDLTLEKWPSYCGAGRSLPDWIIPDNLYGANVAPACFSHDIDWIIALDTYLEFQAANNRFLRNLNALCKAQLSGWKYIKARGICLLYWAAVSTVGMKHFAPSYAPETYPMDNPDIREKLHRLAMANLNTV